MFLIALEYGNPQVRSNSQNLKKIKLSLFDKIAKSGSSRRYINDFTKNTDLYRDMQAFHAPKIALLSKE